ncbi:hypothetical protein BDV96DRAFT_286751 [Lophiotrema nucula]|uniref:Uncharacterized protein n=1 Tax=Lophiotrema nucula TaxID=690887 RepID=A0A6A5YM07_9PLEO|nr:hypothetical protein BDV96DRAFT_286751 [Lophiotrema nucula]
MRLFKRRSTTSSSTTRPSNLGQKDEPPTYEELVCSHHEGSRVSLQSANTQQLSLTATGTSRTRRPSVVERMGMAYRLDIRRPQTSPLEETVHPLPRSPWHRPSSTDRPVAVNRQRGSSAPTLIEVAVPRPPIARPTRQSNALTPSRSISMVPSQRTPAPDPALLSRSRSESLPRTPVPAVARKVDKLTTPCSSCGKERWWCSNANNVSGTDFQLAPRMGISIEAKDQGRLREYWKDSPKHSTEISRRKYITLYLVPSTSDPRRRVELRVCIAMNSDGRAIPNVRLCEAKIAEITSKFGYEVAAARNGQQPTVFMADETDEFVLQVSLRCI